MSAGASGDSSGPLALLGQAMGAVVSIEEQLSTSLNAVAKVLPSFPAVRIMDIDIGLPHAHDHPPNLIPPAPPVPLPSVGPIIPIPILSGANQTLINGLPAARCGDMGLGIWCGGFLPLYEVFLGSSNVWIEGARAARVGVDITNHCVFSSPKPSDPPMGPMVGFTITCSGNVLIGGVPMPSLTALALAEAFKALGKLLRAGMRAAQDLGERLGLRIKPGFLKCDILKAEPVDITTGENVIEQQDFELPWPLPITWTRRYGSRSTRMGHCGYGWETPADARLLVERDGAVLFYDGSAGNTLFPTLPEQGPVREFVDGGILDRAGGHLKVRRKDGLTYHFGALDHRTTEYLVERISDQCGNSLTFRRDAGALQEIVSSCGARLEIVNQEGRIGKIILHHPLEHEPRTLVGYEYDGEGDLREVCDALQNRYRFFYRNHCLIRHTDRNALSFYYEFDCYTPEGRVLHTWGDGRLYDYQFKYDPDAGLVQIIDSLGHARVVAFDDSGLPVSETDPLGGVTRFEYDEVGRTTVVVDPAGLRTEYQYDEFGNLLKMTRPDGKSVQTEYNAGHKAVKITDCDGAVWRQEWDARGLLLRQISPLSNEIHYNYDTHGRVTAFTNARGARTRLAFDAFGNLIRLVNALGQPSEFVCDALGNMTARTDPVGRRISYAYDLKGRLTKVALPSGAAVECKYDAQDNLVQYRDENGAVTKLEYCGLGEIRRRRQPDGHTVQFHYDTEEQLIGVTNQRGERFELRRDALGRIVEEVDYWGQRQRYSYTPSGHLRESVDPLGRSIRYETDPLGRIRKKILLEPANPQSQQVERFEYDANGNLISMKNAHAEITRTFDAEGRLIREAQGQDFILENTYDRSGNRIARKTSLGNCVAYEFDLLDRVSSVRFDDSEPIRIERDANGKIIRETLAPRLTRHRNHNADGLLTEQSVVADGLPQLATRYQYDPAGNLTQRSDSQYGEDTYCYDPLGRTREHIDPRGRLTQYLNDPAGDRLLTRIMGNGASEDSTPTLTESESGYAWRRLGEHEGTRYCFDRAGNLVERRDGRRDLRLLWDANQRLIESHANGTSTRYGYDPLGRRLFKQTGEARTRFFWDGDALLGENTLSLKENSARASREYVYYPSTFEPLAMLAKDTNGRQVFHYQNDPNGCPVRLIDSSGQVKWSASYTAWGGVAKFHLNVVDNPIRLQGQYHDAETGLSYNRHRYFDSRVGAFVSIDPLGLRGGIHLYRYANNVLGWVDPLGLNCDPADAAREAANKIPDKFKKLFMCKQFAKELEERLQALGIPGTRLNLQSRTAFIVSDKLGRISEDGTHVAIKVGDTVFDNLHPAGINHADFIKDLGGPIFTNFPHMIITETPF